VGKNKKNFATHGIPETVICDNGVQFNSAKFRSFAPAYEFSISPCSPYHKEGNGKAVITKALIFKTVNDGTDFNLALLNLRNTPNKIGTSPTQRLVSRQTRCMIPVSSELLKPQIVRDIKKIIINKKSQAKF
jgi:hypothetical protein